MLVLQLRHVDVTAEDHKNHDQFIHVRSALSTHRTLLTSSGVVTLTLAPGRRRNFPLCHYSPSFPFLPPLLSTRRPSIESPTDAAHCLRSADQRDHRCRNIFVEIILALSSPARSLPSSDFTDTPSFLLLHDPFNCVFSPSFRPFALYARIA